LMFHVLSNFMGTKVAYLLPLPYEI